MLAFISLTTPILLGGLALITLPVIAHLLHRRSRREIVFPSIAMLVESVAQQSQMNRLKRWLLLLLRALAVACIVMAFTRPVWLDADQSEAVNDGDVVGLVLLADVSASSGQRVGGVTALAELKSAGGRVLDDLVPGQDVVGLVIADLHPRSVFPRLTANLPGLRQELAKLTPMPQRADVPKSFVEAGRLLERHEGPKRLVILTDLQRDTWQLELSKGTLGKSLPLGTVISVITPDSQAPGNTSLTNPRSFPSHSSPGDPIDLTVQVGNHTDSTKQLVVRYERFTATDEQLPLSREDLTVRLEPYEKRDFSWHLESVEQDREIVRFSIPQSDALPIDNEAWLVCEPAPSLPVAILSDDNPNMPGTAGYYLLRALRPKETSSHRFLPQHIRSSELNEATLSPYDVLLVGYLAPLTESRAKALAAFLVRGGGIIFFSGEGSVDRNLAAIDSVFPSGTLLPWQPGPRRTGLASRDGFHIDSGRWQSRWFRQFDEQSQLAIEQIHFRRVWSAGAVSSEAEVLLLFDDKTPALGARAVGAGQFVLASFSPDITTSDLARHGAFVALVQMITNGVRPVTESQSEIEVGEPILLTDLVFDLESSHLEAETSDGLPVSLNIKTTGEKSLVTIPVTESPGIYRVHDGQNVIAARAVNLSPRESDLRRLELGPVEQSLVASGVTVLSSSDDSSSPVGRIRGEPLWGRFFTGALCLIGLELFLLGLWRR